MRVLKGTINEGGRNSFVKVAHIYVLRMVEKKDKRGCLKVLEMKGKSRERKRILQHITLT